MTAPSKAFALSRLQEDRVWWLKQLELCPKGEPLLRSYIERSLDLVTQDIAEAVDA